MYNCKYKCCGCNNGYDEALLEDVCNNAGSMVPYFNPKEQCQCGFEEEWSPFPECPMLAQSYVPIQKMNKTFKPCVGLKLGTIFPELVSPYMPCQSIEENAYIKSTNKMGEGCNKC